ncbi:hypothetical protein glysoja_000253 [Glycine soja]|nr:hypothetical protein glysoja_000253 [Glycine soja]
MAFTISRSESALKDREKKECVTTEGMISSQLCHRRKHLLIKAWTNMQSSDASGNAGLITEPKPLWKLS